MNSVLFIIYSNPYSKTDPGGIQSYIIKMASLLEEKQTKVDILTIDTKDSLFSISKFIRCFTVKKRSNLLIRVLCKIIAVIFHKRHATLPEDIINAYYINKKYKKISRAKKYNIVQISNYRLIGLFINDNNITYRLSSSRLQCDIIDKEYSILSRLIERLDVYCIKKASFAYCPSKRLSEYFNKTYNLNTKVIISPFQIINYNPVLTNEPKFLADNDNYILFYGHISILKGIIYLIESIKEELLGGTINLVMIGTIKENVKNYFKANSKVINKIDYYPSMGKAELFTYISNAMACVLPSLFDNIPNTALESLSLGIPVITISDSSIDEIIVNRVNGIVVDKDKPEHLREAILDVISNKITFSPEDVINCTNSVFKEYKPIDKFLSISDLNNS